MSAETKRCTKCGEVKPVTAFNADRRKADGLYSWCRSCHRQANTAWRAYPDTRERGRQVNAARRATPEGWAVVAANAAAARARKRGVPCTVTAAFLVVLHDRTGGVCPVTKRPFKRGAAGRPCDDSPSVECIYPKYGYVPGNVCIVSNRANQLMSDGEPHELRRAADFREAIRATADKAVAETFLETT